MGKRSLSVIVGALLVGSLLATGGPAAAVEGCAPPAAGGEWPSYGQNLSNTRVQTEPTAISRDNVTDLHGVWSLGATEGQNMRSTPVAADGCIFTTSFGPGPGLGVSALATVYAVNADTGDLVWSRPIPSPPALIVGVYAPAVVDGVVYAAVSSAGSPYVVAIDEATGEIIWTTYLYQSAFDADLATGINASMVAFDGMLFVPFTGADAIGLSHPSFYILDAETGMMLKKTIVIPQEYWTSNFAGGGIWGTAAVDEQSKHLYVGTSNPYNKRQEHRRTNSILKIDVNPKRFTFGEIVGNYKGDVDYNPELYNTPQCVYLSELILVGFSTFCGQDDVDFGASPNLWKDAEGRVIVGDLQKSGTYHAVDTETMDAVWQARNVSSRSAGGNAATSAVDDTTVYVASNGGKVSALDRATGAVRWESNTGDAGSHYQPVTVANDVVYTLGNQGQLFALDAATGDLLLTRKLEADGVTCGSTAGAGVIVARNMLYATCDSGPGAADEAITSLLPGLLTGPQSGILFALSI